MHEREAWGMLTGPDRPLYLRVMGLAFAGHHRNGHTPFAPGELRRALPVVDKRTGELRVPTVQAITNAIHTAVSFGYLHEDSVTSRQHCLVVPHWITGGDRGNSNEPCKRHSSFLG